MLFELDSDFRAGEGCDRDPYSERETELICCRFPSELISRRSGTLHQTSCPLIVSRGLLRSNDQALNFGIHYRELGRFERIGKSLGGAGTDLKRGGKSVPAFRLLRVGVKLFIRL
jgi:hypothetical protein